MNKIYFLLAAVMTALSLNAATVDDILTIDVFGITKKTTYTDVTGVTATSAAVYSANVCRSSSDVLQFRSKNNNSGVVTTATGGKLSKISVVWNTETSTGNKIDVYASNTAYSAPTDLYDTAKQGTKIGTIECGVTTELTVAGDYTFLGFRSAGNAIYLDSVTVTWETDGTVETVAAPAFSLESGKYNGSQSLEINVPDGAQLFVKVNADEFGDAVASPCTVALEAAADRTATYEVEAYAQVADRVSKTVKATYIIIPESTGKYGRFDLVTSLAQLTNGCRVVIVDNKENAYAMSKTWAYGESCTAVDVVVADNKIQQISNDVAVYNVTFDGTYYAFYDPFAVNSEGTSVAGYICAVSSKKNYLGTQTELDNEGRFSVTIAENGDATAVSQGDFTHNTLRYNYGAFRAYGANTSVATLVRFYVEDQSSSVKTLSADLASVRTVAAGIEVEGRGQLTVVNAAGQVVATRTVDGRASLSLPRGFYIVRLASTTAKVIVR